MEVLFGSCRAPGLRHDTDKLRSVAAKLPLNANLATLGPPVVQQLGSLPISEHDAFRGAVCCDTRR